MDEGTRDDSGNGVPNYLSPFWQDEAYVRRTLEDQDTDGDGIPDNIETSLDTDGLCPPVHAPCERARN